MTTALDALRKEHLHRFAAYLEAHMTEFGVIPQHGCGFCHGTGWAETVDGDGYAWVTRCPQGCPVPEADALIPHHREVT